MTDDEFPTEYRVPAWLGFNHSLPLNLTLGTARTGLWCDTCLLPSQVQVPLYALGVDGPYEVGTFDRCDRCSP